MVLAALLAVGSFSILAAPSDSATPRKRVARSAPKKRLGRYKIGPLYLTPKLSLKSAGVDRNVFNSQTGAIPDTSIVLSPSISGALPVGERLRLTGKGSIDFNYFRLKGAQGSTDFVGEGRAELDVGRFTLFGGGGGGQFKQRFSIDLDERLLRQEKWATTGFDLRITRKLSATLSGTGSVYAFAASQITGSSVQKALGRNVLTGTAQLRYALTSQTKLLVSGDAIEDRFLQHTTEPRRARSYRYLGGLEFGERAHINGKILAGIREFPGGQGTPTYRGPALAVSASFPFLRLGRLVGFAEREVFYSVSSAGVGGLLRNAYVSTSLRAEADVELPFGLIARGLFGYQEAKYLLPYQRVDHLWTGGGSVLRRFGRAAAIGGTVFWGRRVSSLPGFSYQGLSYGIQAEVAP